MASDAHSASYYTALCLAPGLELYEYCSHERYKTNERAQNNLLSICAAKYDLWSTIGQIAVVSAYAIKLVSSYFFMTISLSLFILSSLMSLRSIYLHAGRGAAYMPFITNLLSLPGLIFLMRQSLSILVMGGTIGIPLLLHFIAVVRRIHHYRKRTYNDIKTMPSHRFLHIAPSLSIRQIITGDPGPNSHNR